MQPMNPEIPIDRFEVFASGLDHPECCAFDRDGNLWAGGEAGQIYRIDPTGKVRDDRQSRRVLLRPGLLAR